VKFLYAIVTVFHYYGWTLQHQVLNVNLAFLNTTHLARLLLFKLNRKKMTSYKIPAPNFRDDKSSTYLALYGCREFFLRDSQKRDQHFLNFLYGVLS